MNPKVRAMLIGYMLQAGKTPADIKAVIPDYSEDEASQSQVTSTGGNPTVNYSTFQNNPRFTPKSFSEMENEDYSGMLPKDTPEPRRELTSDEMKMIVDPKFSKMVDNITPPKEQPKPSKSTFQDNMPYFPFLGDMSLESRLFAAGQGIGKLTAKDEEGNRLVTGAQRAGAWGQTVGGAGSFLLGSARVLASGAGYEKRNAYIDDWYRKRQQDQYYTPNQQYKNANYLGGISQGKFGGLFEEGGEQEEMMEQPQTGPQEMAENEGQMNPQMQQVMMQVAQAIEDGESPQMIIQALMKRGMSQEQATQTVTQVVQKIQQHEQEQSGEGSEEMMLRKGGRFNYKVGDHIKFKAGGVMKEGKISRIENGKIFL